MCDWELKKLSLHLHSSNDNAKIGENREETCRLPRGLSDRPDKVFIHFLFSLNSPIYEIDIAFLVNLSAKSRLSSERFGPLPPGQSAIVVPREQNILQRAEEFVSAEHREYISGEKQMSFENPL